VNNSLGQFLRDLAASFRLFWVKPQCPYERCHGARFPFDVYEDHVRTHRHDEPPLVRRWEDVRDPAGRWARQTGEEA
jgi:hypothetical protein